MKAEQFQLALRPRPAYEAVDLGVRIAQESLGSLRRAYLPLMAMLVVACGSTVELSPWLPSLLLWWLKPWIDRILINVYARHAFGEPTSFSQAWEARRQSDWGSLASLLTITRLSVWRSYGMPVAQLEGQSGAARRDRLRAILRTQRSPAMMMQGAFSLAEMLVSIALLSLVGWMVPGLTHLDTLKFLVDDSLTSACVMYAAYAAAVMFVEPFYVAAGFAMYLNRRVELEAWDVEQELRHAFDHG